MAFRGRSESERYFLPNTTPPPPFLISSQQFRRTLALVHEWTECEFPIWSSSGLTGTSELEMAVRPFHPRLIIMSNTACVRFSFYGNEYLPVVGMRRACARMSGVLLGFDNVMKIKQYCQTNMWQLSPSLPTTFVNHQQRRRRRNVLLSFTCSQPHTPPWMLLDNSMRRSYGEFILLCCCACVCVRLCCVCAHICVHMHAFKVWVYQRRGPSFSQTGDKAQRPLGSEPPNYCIARAGCHSDTAAGGRDEACRVRLMASSVVK